KEVSFATSRYFEVSKEGGSLGLTWTCKAANELRAGFSSLVYRSPVEKKVYLRLERKGVWILLWSSRDGKDWRRELKVGISLPQKLKVGVKATSSKQCKATFDQFRLTPLSDLTD